MKKTSNFRLAIKEEIELRRLEGKVAIITEGTGGIGRRTVEIFAKEVPENDRTCRQRLFRSYS